MAEIAVEFGTAFHALRVTLPGIAREESRPVKRLFIEHPASVGESYPEHMAQAASFALRLFLASLACLVHALLPFLFVRTGSAAIAELHDRMVVNRRRQNRHDLPAGAVAKARR